MPGRLAALGALACAVGVCAASAAGPQVPSLTLRSSREVLLKGVFSDLVADGWEAVGVPDAEAGNPSFLTVWNMRTGASITYRAARNVGCTDCSLHPDEVALARGRLAFTRVAYVSHVDEYVQLLVARPGQAPVQVADSFDTSGEGDLLRRLLGDGSLIAFQWESLDAASDDYFSKALRLVDSPGALGAQDCPRNASALVDRRPNKLCATMGRPDDLTDLLAVDAGRVLLDDARGVTMLDAAGTPRASYSIELGTDDEVALSGDTIFVARPKALDLFTTSDGARIASLPARPRSMAAGAGFLYYDDRGTMRLVRVSDRAQVTLRLPAGALADGVRIESTGIFYLYRTKNRARIGFEPLARLRADFDRAVRKA